MRARLKAGTTWSLSTRTSIFRFLFFSHGVKQNFNSAFWHVGSPSSRSNDSVSITYAISVRHLLLIFMFSLTPVIGVNRSPLIVWIKGNVPLMRVWGTVGKIFRAMMEIRLPVSRIASNFLSPMVTGIVKESPLTFVCTNSGVKDPECFHFPDPVIHCLDSSTTYVLFYCRRNILVFRLWYASVWYRLYDYYAVGFHLVLLCYYSRFLDGRSHYLGSPTTCVLLHCKQNISVSHQVYS